MLETYSVLIKRDDNNKVVGYYYPDFNFEYGPIQNEPGNLSKHVADILIEHIKRLARSNSVPFPQKITHWQGLIPIGPKDNWSLCYVKPFFIKQVEKYLPSFGIFSSIMAAMTMAVINFYTTSESINSKSGVWFGSIGAVLSAIMAIIVYFFSNASGISKIIGRKVDDFVACLPQSFFNLFNDAVSSDTNYTKQLLKVLLTFLPILTTTFSSYNHYNQVTAVVKNSEDDNSHISVQAFYSLSLIMIIFSSYSSLIFQLSFMPAIYEKIDQGFNHNSRFFNGATFFNPHTQAPDEMELLAIDSDSDESDVLVI